MANTYTQIYLQFVFAVKHRQALIPRQHKEELHKYITGLVQLRKSKMIAIHCMPDHAHIFVGYNSDMKISDFVKEIKIESGEFVRDKRWCSAPFHWQSGYGAFSYSRPEISTVAAYIENQELHHKKHSFRDEYIALLEEFDISYSNDFLFEFFD